MKLYLIRHAECGHNVGQAAGDENGHHLTENGRTQVLLLARSLRDRMIRFTHVFSSDLDRASETAQGICQQQLASGALLAPIQVPTLREQQYGSLEGTRWHSGAPASSISSPDALRGGEPTYTDEESVVSMRTRMNAFLQDHIIPFLVNADVANEEVIAVVAHGVILQVLWVCLADLFNQRDVHLGPGIGQADFGDYVRPVWSNTGVMELDIRPASIVPPYVRDAARPPPFLLGSMQRPESFEAPLSGWSMTVMAVDDTTHLETTAQQVERTGGTVRNSLQPSRQETANQFYRLTGTA
ncbi:phosphoglycerate mutase family protein [Aspergillus udagawae]|uniref:Phosphoglycerate mutase family protein n=1 Tax=Aspergillus udagawae TaxID=91492 RepID=A0A8E0V4C0_9EURO|nr:uncharacterized protein Aud_010054 [Aspergillus udagawae]GFF89116.1 phosphoglycerate mutase family protein [Aspergillus udagawae]GIC93566.1 hypothetical protein Aud_010054 [Aspergillus udagawae]